MMDFQLQWVDIERVPRTSFISPLRARGAQPAWASLRRGYLRTENWAGAARSCGLLRGINERGCA
jgi:hypothetical protein